MIQIYRISSDCRAFCWSASGRCFPRCLRWNNICIITALIHFARIFSISSKTLARSVPSFPARNVRRWRPVVQDDAFALLAPVRSCRRSYFSRGSTDGQAAPARVRVMLSLDFSSSSRISVDRCSVGVFVFGMVCILLFDRQ